MNKHDFTALVKNPSKIGELETEKLRELVQTYPYFSVARNLLVKSLHDSSHYDYENALKQAALLTGNRAVLYNLVHDLPLNTDVPISQEEEVEVLEIKPEETYAPIISLVQTETPKPEIILEAPTAIPEIEPIKVPKVRSTEITEDEKLVQPTGKFVKFVPNKPAKENKPINNGSIISANEEEVLSGFDLSSLDSIANWQNPKPIHEEAPPVPVILPEPEIEPEPIVEVIPEPIPEPELIPEPILAPQIEIVQELPVEVEANNESTSEDFLSWLRKKEVVKVEEDENFVREFTEELAQQSQLALSEEIKQQVDSVVLVEEVKVEVEEIIELKEIIEVVEIVEIKEKVEVTESEELVPEESSIDLLKELPLPEFEFDFDFGKKPEEPAAQVEEDVNLLASLEAYEIDIFLAPIYRNAKFELEIFETDFISVYPSEDGLEESLEEEEKSLLDFKKAVMEEIPAANLPKFVPFTEEGIVLPERPEPVKRTPIPVEKPALKAKKEIPAVESILDKFIRENPTIARPKSEFYSPLNMAKQSVENDDGLVSETLAQIYLGQGFHKKAITMYEKLGLLYPDKLAYFAGLIENIKNENNLN